MTSAYGSDAIWDAFDDSIVQLLIDDTWVTYGADPIDLPEPLFGVTGWNPGEERPLEDNEAANAALAQRLRELGIRFVDAVGSAPDHSWREPGFALIGTTRDVALDLATRFGQLAIHEMSGGKLMVVKTGIAIPDSD